MEDENSVEVITVTFPQTPAEHDGVTDFQCTWTSATFQTAWAGGL